MCSDADVDRVLAGWRQSDQDAVDDLSRLVYDGLRVLTHRHLRRRAGETLGQTPLVHKVYLRFAQLSSPDLLDRGHFVALAARAMRMVIVDHWRRKQARKRDPQAPVSASLDDVAAPEALPPIDILALDEALRRLSEVDARQAQVVELRFFGGLTLDEVAVAFGVSERTVKWDWQKARAFLSHAIRSFRGKEDALRARSWSVDRRCVAAGTSKAKRSRGGIKLLDLGLARFDVPGASDERALVGTPQYMSPGQLDRRPADTQSDIFACGAVFYEMVTGQRAFAGSSRASVIAAIRERDPAP